MLSLVKSYEFGPFKHILRCDSISQKKYTFGKHILTEAFLMFLCETRLAFGRFVLDGTQV